MLCCAVLCCAVLCCAVLCCAVLCCAVLCAVPCRAVKIPVVRRPVKLLLMLWHAMLMIAFLILQASPDAGTALAALSIPDQQSKPALKHEARSCATASQLLPPGKPNPGFGNGPSVTISDFTALLKSDQNAQANSNLQPLLLNKFDMPHIAKQAVGSVKTSLGTSSAGDTAEQLQAALRQAQNAPQPSGNALTDVSTQVHDLGQSFRSMLQRMTALEATVDSMRQQQQQQQQPESRRPNQAVAQHVQQGRLESQQAQQGQGRPQHAQHSQGRSQHVQHATHVQAAGLANVNKVVEMPQVRPIQTAAEHPHIQTLAGQRQHSMHSMQLEPSQAVKTPVKFLRGAIRRLDQEATQQAAPAVNGDRADEAMLAACPTDISGQPQTPPVQLPQADSPRPADRQEQQSLEPQVVVHVSHASNQDPVAKAFQSSCLLGAYPE